MKTSLTQPLADPKWLAAPTVLANTEGQLAPASPPLTGFDQDPTLRGSRER